MNTAAIMMTMIAEHGTSTTVPTKSPATLHISDTATDNSIIGLKRRRNISAVIIGSDSIDISSITPTSLIVRTIQTAVKTVIV